MRPETSSPNSTATSLFSATAGRGLAILDLLFCNFESRVPGGEFVLLALVGSGLLIAGLGGRHGAIQIAGATGRADWRWPAGAVGLISLTVIANALVERRFVEESPLIAAMTLNVRRVLALLVLLGFVWLARSARIRGLAVRLRAAWPGSADTRVLAIALVVPWSILLLLTEPDREDRMFGIWPLQIVFAAGFISAVYTSAASQRMVRWALPALAAVVIVLNPFVLERTRSWVRTGWAGPDSAELQLADYLGGLLRSAGRTQAAIGYVRAAEPSGSSEVDIDPRAIGIPAGLSTWNLEHGPMRRGHRCRRRIPHR